VETFDSVNGNRTIISEESRLGSQIPQKRHHVIVDDVISEFEEEQILHIGSLKGDIIRIIKYIQTKSKV